MKADVSRVSGGRVGDHDAQPPVVGSALWRPIDRLYLRATNALRRALPDALNPLLQIGAIANIALIAAIASGILLLIWYTPSHTGAWQSTIAMAEAPLTAGLMRSLHRYASDATILFSLLHGLQILAARRLAGPRWVAWVTGLLAVGLIWFIGWTGYWLVWDERAQLVATGTAKVLDVLPIFTDPLSRSFITNESVSSLLFFVVFFLHMLLPLLIGILLWLHLTRLSRPRFLPPWKLIAWVVGTLVLLSLVLPATSAPAADMTRVPAAMTMDWWYLLPAALTDRLSGGMLWLVSFVLGVVVLGAPWWLVRKRAPRPAATSASAPAPTGAAFDETCRVTGATITPAPAPSAPPPPSPQSPRRAAVASVDEAKCNACETCFHDCPYDAISMIARTDGRKFPSVAFVDPERCVGCGICAGSCDSSGIGVPWLTQPHERHRVDAWLEASPPGSLHIAFACARSAAGTLTVQDDGTSAELPGYRVLPVPCAGWVHPLTVERALRRGAAGVAIISCRPGSCAYREGATWTQDRLAGTREPAFRSDHADPDKVLHLALDEHEKEALLVALAVGTAHADEEHEAATPTGRSRVLAAAVGLVVAGTFALLTWIPSDLPYHTPATPEPQLVVSFKLAGEVTERCRTLTPEELAALPAHKRIPKVCERGREPVHLTVEIGDAVVIDRDYEPSGAFGDGSSVALETLAVSPGRHRVTLTLGTGSAPPSTDARELDFQLHSRRVVMFDRLSGFSWH